MWDKADIRIPFHADHVTEVSCLGDQLSGVVFPRDYDFPTFAPIAYIDGQKVYQAEQAQRWGTIPSSISDIAVGFFPEGQGLYYWPHVSVKCSPSKLLQGHNVFGTEDITHGIAQMLTSLSIAFPKIWRHLDINSAEIRYLDSTYSAYVPSDYQREQVLRVFESLFPAKESIKRYTGYLQGNKSSEYRRQKIYYKHQELAADYENAVKRGRKEKAAILGDKRLQDFAYGRMRFEATTGPRGLQSLGIPTNLIEFQTFNAWYESVHNEPLCRHLWRVAFDKYFSQLEGHTMKNVDDEKIKLKIDNKYMVVKEDGRICRRKANSIFKTYRAIKTEGYDTLNKERNATFRRHVKLMDEIGISRAFLKSLDPRTQDNVISFINVINVDFSNQRPTWYQEPKAGFDQPHRHLRLVS